MKYKQEFIQKKGRLKKGSKQKDQNSHEVGEDEEEIKHSV